jgi:hypothetical protein
MADREGNRGRAVYVYGAKHSGTTILYKMLALHPDVTWFSQYSLRDGSIPGRRRLPMTHRLDRVLRARRRHDWHKEEQGLSRLVPRPGEAATISKYVRSAPTRAEAAERLRRAVSTECERWDKDVLLAKPLHFRHHLEVIPEAHPDARLLHITRDGRAVAASCMDDFMDESETAADAATAAAADWVDTVEEVDRIRDISLDVRYEELCADVHGELKRALEFAGLDLSSFPFDELPLELKATNERRIARLGSGELQAVQHAQARTLRAHGY